MLATEQIGPKYSLMIGSAGQAFAMFYIGIQGAVAPSSPGQGLTGSGTFAIISVYVFVVFYSISWSPIPFVLAAECSANHVRSLSMALSLMTQWLFNFVIARTVPSCLPTLPTVPSSSSAAASLAAFCMP
jgi:SP family sugar:H+ symporter-like MFS transporter